MVLHHARRREAENIFQEVADLPPEQRRSTIRDRCGGDREVEAEVESLLACWEGGRIASLIAVESRETSDADLLGEFIGPYHLLELLGEGGFGSVYMAEQHEPVRRRVALKLIKLGMDTKQVIARFEAERQALAMMDHPGIAQVFEAGAAENGRPYFAMELVRGVRITDYCDGNCLSTRERLGLFAQVCRAVQHAHQKGVIHRDIKPSNVLVTVRDGVAMPKIIDFGVAKATSARLTEKTLFTGFSQFVGTPEYMSPEQAVISAADVDTRSDVYSLGVMLYELLTGLTPWDPLVLRKTTYAEFQRILREEDPPTPSERLSTLGSEGDEVARFRRTEPHLLFRLLRGDLDWIVMRALEKDRARRYGTAADLAADVERHLRDQPVQAGPPRATYRFGKFVRRNRAFVVAGVLLATVVAIGSTFTAIGFVRARSEARRAANEAESAKAINAFFTDMLLSADPMGLQMLSAFALDDPITSPVPRVVTREVSVSEMVKEASQSVAEAFAGKPELEASVRETMGMTLWSHGQHLEARSQLESALDIRRQVLRADHPDILRLLLELGQLQWECGRGDIGAPLVRAAWEGMRQVYGLEHPKTLNCASMLATCLMGQGKTEDAKAMFRETLGQQKRILGVSHPDTLETMIGWSQFHRGQGDGVAGPALARQTHDISNRVFGPADATTLSAAMEVGLWELWGGHYDEGERVFRELLNQSRRTLGDEHPFTCLTMTFLAAAIANSPAVDECERLYHDSLTRLREIVGDGHALTAYTFRMFGPFLHGRGKLDEAETLYRDWLVSSDSGLGEAVPSTLTVMDYLSNFYEQTGKPSEGIIIYRDRLAAVRRANGPHSKEAIEAMSALAKTLRGYGRIKEARRLTVEAIAVARTTAAAPNTDSDTLATCAALLLECDPGDLRDPVAGLSIARRAVEDPGGQTDKPLKTLALAYRRAGDLELAAATYEQVLALFPADSVERIVNAAPLAEVLDELGRPKAAGDIRRNAVEGVCGALAENRGLLYLRLWQAGMALRLTDDFAVAELSFGAVSEVSRAVHGRKHPRSVLGLVYQADCCHEQGKYAEAAALYQEALPAYREVYGNEDVQLIELLRRLGTARYHTGEASAAEPLLREALAMIERLGLQLIPAALTATRDLASVLTELGRLDEAESLAQLALSRSRDLYGASHTHSVRALQVFGQVLVLCGETEQAERELRLCLEIYERLELPKHQAWFVAEAQSTLGACLLRKGKAEEAEPLLLTAHEQLAASGRAASIIGRRARERIVSLYETWGKPERAAEWRSLLYESGP